MIKSDFAGGRLMNCYEPNSDSISRTLNSQKSNDDNEFGRILGELSCGLQLVGSNNGSYNKQSIASDEIDTSYLEARAKQTEDAVKHAQMVAKTEAAVKRIAGYLGVSYKFLLMVMDSLGIKPEDLLDGTKVGEIVKKLSEYFGFDEEKKKEFEEFASKSCQAINEGYY